MRSFDTEIPAVFPSRTQAAEAVYELVSLGLADEYLERAVNGAADRIKEDDAEREVFRSVVTGVAIGVVLGCVLGALLVYAGELVAGVTATWSSAFAGGIGGSLAGIFFGSVFGAASRSHLLEQRDRWADTELRDAEMLVVAHSHGWADVVRQVLEQHGGRSVDGASGVRRRAA